MTTAAIAAIVVGERVRKDMGDLAALAASIAEHGLLHAIVIKPDRTLIAGERRLRACQSLGWTDVPVRIVDVDDLLSAERAENEVRKDFTPSEAVAIARVIEEARREQATARKREAGRIAGLKSAEVRGVARQPKVLETLQNLQAETTRDTTAAAVGMSGPTYYRAKRIVEAAESDPAQFGDLVERMDRTGKVHGVYNELEQRKGGRAPRHAILRKMRYPKPNREIERALFALDGICRALQRLAIDQLDPARTAQWSEDLRRHAAALNKTSRRLRNEDPNQHPAHQDAAHLEARDDQCAGPEIRSGGAAQALAQLG